MTWWYGLSSVIMVAIWLVGLTVVKLLPWITFLTLVAVKLTVKAKCNDERKRQ